MSHHFRRREGQEINHAGWLRAALFDASDGILSTMSVIPCVASRIIGPARYTDRRRGVFWAMLAVLGGLGACADGAFISRAMDRVVLLASAAMLLTVGLGRTSNESA